MTRTRTTMRTTTTTTTTTTRRKTIGNCEDGDDDEEEEEKDASFGLAMCADAAEDFLGAVPVHGVPRLRDVEDALRLASGTLDSSS